MSEQLKQLHLCWIVLGREKSCDKDSTNAAVQPAYNKDLRKCFWILTKIQNTKEAQICAQYTSAAYDKDPESLWKKLEQGYRKALGLELNYFRRSLFDGTFDAYLAAGGCVHEIERVYNVCARHKKRSNLARKPFTS